MHGENVWPVRNQVLLCVPFQNNTTSLNVTFNIDDWPKSCCQMAVEVTPESMSRRKGSRNHAFISEIIIADFLFVVVFL